MMTWYAMKTSLRDWRRRWIPYLVWYGDEVDVGVTIMTQKLNPDADPMEQLWSGHMADLERKIGDIGIGFDRGLGPDGRDWEWDWSLSGPISVRFRSRATKPELRRERFRPKLVASR